MSLDRTLAQVEARYGPLFPLAQELHRALEGAIFPLHPKHLASIARENDAPRRVVSILAGLKPRLFRTLDEVTVATAADRQVC